MKLKHISHETKEISEGGRFTTIFSAERVFRVGFVQAAGIIFTTFVAGFAGSLIVRFNTAVSLPGRVSAVEVIATGLSKDFADAKKNFLSKDLADERLKNTDRQFTEILSRLDLIQGGLMSLK